MPEQDNPTSLPDAAIEIAIQNGVALRVTVRYVMSTKHDGTASTATEISLLLWPNTTVHELKTTLREELGIPEKEQRLWVNDQALLDGTLEQVASTSGELVVRLQQVALDPRLESLFEMVGLQDWQERDQIMDKMTWTRLPRKCHEDHELKALVDNNSDFACAKCHTLGIASQSATACKICHFCLCYHCFQQDEGSRFIPYPYETIKEMAVDIGRRMATDRVGNNSIGRGHCNPRVRIVSELAPRMFREPGGRGYAIKPNTKVLHDGVRLRVTFNQEAQDFLQSGGLEGDMMEKVVDQILPDGATVDDMVRLREAWHSGANNLVWKALVEEWSMGQFPFHGDRAQPHATANLISFGIEEVVYEVGVEMDNDDGDH